MGWGGEERMGTQGNQNMLLDCKSTVNVTNTYSVQIPPEDDERDETNQDEDGKQTEPCKEHPQEVSYALIRNK